MSGKLFVKNVLINVLCRNVLENILYVGCVGVSSSRHSYNADLYHKPSRRIEARIDTDIPIFVSIMSYYYVVY